MFIKFNTNNALKEWRKLGGTSKFVPSLIQVLNFMQSDSNIQSKEEAAYLLATAAVESDYSLQRWESDFLCGPVGVPYDDQPCDRALRYYRSTEGNKRNYYELGLDKNGRPYFGRGLIQLTGKSNYEKYGNMIGVNLVDDAEKAMIPKNSYRVASAYQRERTFKYVHRGDFAGARRSVKGSSSGWQEAKTEYDRWMTVFNSSDVKFGRTPIPLKARNLAFYGGMSLGSILLGFLIVSYVDDNSRLLK